MESKPIVLVLDYDAAAKADEVVARIDPSLCRLKVGKQLFTAAGPQYVDRLIARGFDVFLDLKYHDIPNTVAAACRVAASQGVWMVNVHASGGRTMMRAAREAIDASAHEDKAPAGTEGYRAGDLRKRALTAPDALLADLTLHPEFGYFTNISREYRVRSIRLGYEQTLAQATAIQALHRR